MAYTDLTPQVITKDGIVPAFASAAAAGNMWKNTGKEYIQVINASGSSINVTVTTPATVVGLAIEDKVVAVAAGVEKKLGPYEPGYFNQPVGATDAGKIYVDYSVETSITVGVFRI